MEKIKKPYYTKNAGDYVVTSLDCGILSIPLAAYQDKNDNPSAIVEKGEAILKGHGVAVDKEDSFLVPLHAFLIQYEDKNILIDAGSGGALPPLGKNGFVIEGLAAIGIKPEQIDTIIFTHLHPDHVGGLLDKLGNMLYPNATLYINAAEQYYWSSAEEQQKVVEFIRPWFDLVKAKLKPYQAQNKVQIFSNEKQFLPFNIQAIPLNGHTPGHTGLLVNHGGSDPILILGDIVHSDILEFHYPDWSMIFDVDPAQAIATRMKTLKWIVDEKLTIGGMHLDAPGIGHVEYKESEGNRGSFLFVPSS